MLDGLRNMVKIHVNGCDNTMPVKIIYVISDKLLLDEVMQNDRCIQNNT